MGVSVPSLLTESTDSMIHTILFTIILILCTILVYVNYLKSMGRATADTESIYVQAFKINIDLFLILPLVKILKLM